MTTDSLTHQLARALAKMPVLTKQQETLKFTALEDYYTYYKSFSMPLDSDVIDDSGDVVNTSRIERNQA
jgi:hypothetical protein